MSEAEDFPCSTCSRPAVRSLGTKWLCVEHSEAILAPIRARVLADESGIGHGRRSGPWRPEYGDHWAMLGCSVCDASWLGEVGEDCTWCTGRADRTLAAQKLRLLRPELPDKSDRRYGDAVAAWATRVAVAVKAEIISEVEGRAAVDRRRDGSEVRHAA